MRLRPIVHVDCDGPITNFDAGALRIVNKFFGTNYTEANLTEWDVFESLGLTEYEWILEDAIEHDEFCLKLDLVPGALDGINELRKFCDVYCLTAPYHIPCWAGQRNQYLQEKLGFTKDHIIQTHAKHLVYGNVFTDDRHKNLLKWQKEWANCNAILWERPSNKSIVWANRTNNWEDFVIKVQKIAERGY